MQPVLELRKLQDRSYTYSIRAPRSGGVVPAPSYVDRGLTSLPACLEDAAQALSINFPRVYVRYQGMCVGEQDVSQLRLHPMRVAGELVQTYLRQCVPLPVKEAA